MRHSIVVRSGLVSLALAGLSVGLVAQKPVQVVRPLRTSLEKQTSLPGRVIGEARLELKSRVTGYIADLPVDYGSELERGELLARIDVPDLEARQQRAEAAAAAAEAGVGDAQAALEVARARIEAAKGDIIVAETEAGLAEIHANRARKLSEKGGITTQELDEAVGRLEMARARRQQANSKLATAEAGVRAALAMVTSAEANRRSAGAVLAEAAQAVTFARLTCPFEQAVVTRRHLDPGALVRMDQDVILEIQRVDKVRAEFLVPERDAAKIAIGGQVDLELDAVPEPRHGTVTRTSRAMSRGKTMIVQVDLDNGDRSLMPGMYVYGTFLLAVEDAALTLPARALRVDADGGHFVLIVDAGRARKVPVEIDTDNGIRVSVASGLTGDEQVISVGTVEHGDPVRVPEAPK